MVNHLVRSRNTGDWRSVVGLSLAALVALTPIFTLIAAYITHVIVCIKTASWILLAFGVIVAPIGIIHGIGAWFGMF